MSAGLHQSCVKTASDVAMWPKWPKNAGLHPHAGNARRTRPGTFCGLGLLMAKDDCMTMYDSCFLFLKFLLEETFNRGNSRRAYERLEFFYCLLHFRTEGLGSSNPSAAKHPRHCHAGWGLNWLQDVAFYNFSQPHVKTLLVFYIYIYIIYSSFDNFCWF